MSAVGDTNSGFFGTFQSAFSALGGTATSSTIGSAGPQNSSYPTAANTLSSSQPASSSAPPSSSSSWGPNDEKLKNSFLKAIGPGGILERAALFKRPFNGVFVPQQRCLEALQITALLETPPNPNYVYDENAPPASARAQLIRDGDGLFDPSLVLRIPHEDAKCREFLALFLEHHIALFDSSGLAQTFALASSDIRGSLTECLDQISVSGRVSTIPIKAQISPVANTTGDGNKKVPFSTAADYLNIFILEDTIMEAYDLKKYITQIISHQQQQEERARKLQQLNNGSNNAANGGRATSSDRQPVPQVNGSIRQPPSALTVANSSGNDASAAATSAATGGLGRFISELFGTSSKQITSDATETVAEVQATQSAFQRFQQKMQRPESRYLARSVTAFIEYCNGTSSISAAANSQQQASGNGANTQQAAAMGVANKHKGISGKEVKSVVDQLMQQVYGIKEWGGAEDIAIEGFEKYIMTKIYARTYCYTDEEKMDCRKFENRLAAFAPFVSEETFELVPHLLDRAQWRQAVIELNAMSDYKCPRDKLVCGMNACRLLIRALEVATRVHQGIASPVALPPHLSSSSAPGAGGESVASPTTAAAAAAAQQQNGGPSSIGSADVFLPALFLCLAKANPLYYVANVRYIDKYRHRSLLDNESGYLLTCLMSAVEFWQNVSADQLGISDQQFAEASAKERELNQKEDWAAVFKAQPAVVVRKPTSPPPQQQQQQPLSRSPSMPTIVSSPAAAAPQSTVSSPPSFSTVPTTTTPAASPPPPTATSPIPTATANPTPISAAAAAANAQPHSDPFDTFFSGSTSSQGAGAAAAPPQQHPCVSASVVPVTKSADCPSPSPSSSPVEAAFAKLEQQNGDIDALTIAELKLIAAEALRLRRAATGAKH